MSEKKIVSFLMLLGIVASYRRLQEFNGVSLKQATDLGPNPDGRWFDLVAECTKTSSK
jgi:hypothetical protein